MADMARQRLLERAGWKFWRCWGSSFALDKDGCLRELVEALSNEGIEPIGESGVDYSGLVEFREVGSNEMDRSFETSTEEFPPQEPIIEEKHELPTREAASLTLVAQPHSPENVSKDASDSTLDQKSKIRSNEGSLNSIISVGDAVKYSVRDSAGIRQEYIIILNQPSNEKLGIINAQEEIAQFLLGKKVGDIVEAQVDGTAADIEILYKHEVAVE
jgi:hypothetical protein